MSSCCTSPDRSRFQAAIGQAARGRAPAPYTIKIIAPEGTRISATAGLAFATEPLPDVTEPVDTLLTAGGQGADVVLADGRIVTAWRDQEEDLFWALRGGGGNFGVVVDMHVQPHDLSSMRSGMQTSAAPSARARSPW
jgi:hypothetical protein